MSYPLGGEVGPDLLFDPYWTKEKLYIFLQMSKSNKTDSLQEIKDSTIQEILLPKKKFKKDTERDTSKDTYKAALDMLATSSSHDSGSDPIGENPMVKPTPPRCSCTFEIGLQGQTSFLNRIHCG